MYKNLPWRINQSLSEKEEEKMDTTEQDIRFNSFHVRTDIKSRFATTVITSRMTNISKEAKEVSFTSKLPEAAFITDFSMQIGDKIVHGEVKEKQAAKQTYDIAKSRGESAGHVFQQTRETDIFTISTNVGANTEVIFTLTYQEILQRVHGVYKHVVNLDLDQIQPTSDVKIEVEIMERGKIIKVHVPKVGPKMGEKTNADLLKFEADPNCTSKSTTDLHGVSTANVFYRISATDLMQHQREGGQFVLLYDVDREMTSGQIQVVNGYFVHFCAPEGLEVLPKHVIFVLDNSGSMMGQKMRQTKDAMRRILGDLKKEDMFNIVWFSDQSKIWKPKSVRATSDNVMKAISDVERMGTEGSTNIHDAIMASLNLLSTSESNPFASMIVFMTDGQANVGPVHEANALVQVIGRRNQETKYTIHTLAFGKDADFGMLQRIASGNNGLACKIYEDLDSDVQLIGFYQQISSPLLSDVKIEYTEGAVDLNSLVYDHTSTFYSGSEMMILGRLNNLSNSDQPIEARVNGRGGRGVMNLMSSCCFQCPFPRPSPPQHSQRLPTRADTDAVQFVERMWAYHTIKKLLKESKLGYCTTVEKEGKRKEALMLSLRYRFVTELTSMVVVEMDLKKVDLEEKLLANWDSTTSYSFGSNVNSNANTFACFGSARGGGRMQASPCSLQQNSMPTSNISAAFGQQSFFGFGASPASTGQMMGAVNTATYSTTTMPAPQSLFGNASPQQSLFGAWSQQPAFGGFGSGPGSGLTFGGAQQQPVFGQGSTPQFGGAFCPPQLGSTLTFGGAQQQPLFGTGSVSSGSIERRLSPDRKPISYLIILISRSSLVFADQSIMEEINQWIGTLATYFQRLFAQSIPKQPYTIRLISVNPQNGRAQEMITLSSRSPDFEANLQKLILESFAKMDHTGQIEDLVGRNEDLEGKKQVWVNVEDQSIAKEPLSDVFNYLDKVARYDYLAKDDLE